MVRYSSLYGVPQCHKTSNTNQKYAKKSNINSKTVFHNHIWHPTKDQMRTHLGSSSFEHYIPSMLIGGSFKSSIDLFNLFLYLFMHLPDVFSHHQSHRFLCSQPSIGIRSTTIRGFAPCTILNEFHVVIFFFINYRQLLHDEMQNPIVFSYHTPTSMDYSPVCVCRKGEKTFWGPHGFPYDYSYTLTLPSTPRNWQQAQLDTCPSFLPFGLIMKK